MKVDLYLDVWPGCDGKNLMAQTDPMDKDKLPAGWKRIKISAEIPDQYIPDFEIEGTAEFVDSE